MNRKYCLYPVLKCGLFSLYEYEKKDRLNGKQQEGFNILASAFKKNKIYEELCFSGDGHINQTNW